MTHKKDNEGGTATLEENQDPNNFAQQFLGLINNEISRTKANMSWLQEFKEQDTNLEEDIILK